MKRRFKLPVAHVDYDVELTSKPVKVDGKRVQGYCDHSKRKIVVQIVENAETVRQVLWHEYHHALFYELGHPAKCDNEALVEGMALATMRVRLDIPWM